VTASAEATLRTERLNDFESQTVRPARLGTLLVERGVVTDEQLAIGLEEQRRTGRPLGDVLIGLGFVSPALVAQSLATQRGGVAKTEYGIAIGAEAGRPAAPVREPPVSTTQSRMPDAPLGAGLRLAPGAAAPASFAAAPAPSAGDPVVELRRRVAVVEAERDAARAQVATLADERDRAVAAHATLARERAAATARIRALEAELAAANPSPLR
jgi:hypothetical protein